MDEAALLTARELVATAQFAQAARALETLHRRFPQHAEAAHALALCWAQMGMADRALPAFERAAALAPADAALHVNYGAALLQGGRAADAVRVLTRATEIDPTLAGAHSNLAHALAATGDLQTSARHFRRAAELFPDAPTFWRDLGRAEARLSRWEEAIAAYRHAAEEDEDCHLDARQELAVALDQAGRGEESLAAWKAILARAPLLPAARNHVVSLLARSNRLDEAETVAREGTELSPLHADFHHNLGMIRSLKGDVPGAVAAWRRALLCDPGRIETSLTAAEGIPLPAPRTDLDHASPFGEEEHRIGLLTFRIHAPDDLSRALAHALPAALAGARLEAGVARHVAPFEKGTGRRADVVEDPLDLQSPALAELTRALRVERWVAGEIAPDLATVRVLTWTAGTTAVQSLDVPLNMADLAPALTALAGFARLPWPPADLPSTRSLLHYGYGATSIVENLALEHLLSSLAGGAFPPAEAEFGRLLIPLMERGDAPQAVGWLERALSARPSAKLFALKGQALFGAGDFDGAREVWGEAAKLDPSVRPPPLAAGWLALRARDAVAAEGHFREAQRVEGDAAAALVGRGVCAMAAGKFAEARERYLEALQASPRMPEAIFQMAVSWWMEGNAGEAAAWGGRLEQHHAGSPLVVTLARMMGRD